MVFVKDLNPVSGSHGLSKSHLAGVMAPGGLGWPTCKVKLHGVGATGFDPSPCLWDWRWRHWQNRKWMRQVHLRWSSGQLVITWHLCISQNIWSMCSNWGHTIWWCSSWLASHGWRINIYRTYVAIIQAILNLECIGTSAGLMALSRTYRETLPKKGWCSKVSEATDCAAHPCTWHSIQVRHISSHPRQTNIGISKNKQKTGHVVGLVDILS